MKTKTAKREKIYVSFNQEMYNSVRDEANKKERYLNKAIKELETIIKKPISDYEAFSKDILGYALKEIKTTFPKPFNLDLGDEATLKMLSIDLANLEECAKHLNTNTEYTIVNGHARIEVDEEKFKQYVETETQFERYDFALQCVDTIEKAVHYLDRLRPQDLASYYQNFVEYSFEQDGKAKISVRPDFVLNGIYL
jgi:NADH/NAD ratio-sensing transcriptional regulator Rex